MVKRHPSLPEQVGKRLRERRKAAGLTQDELAALSGVGQSAISALEKGHTQAPEAETILRLAETLKTTAHYLMWDHHAPVGGDSQFEALNAAWQTLSDASKARVVAYAEGLRDASPKPRPPTSPRKDTH